MKFSIEKRIFQTAPNLCVGVVVAKGIDNTHGNSTLADNLQAAVSEAKCKFGTQSAKEIPELLIYRDTLEKLSINPNKYPCSIEALLNRVVKDKGVSSISAVVDLLNTISITYGVAIGAHDMDTLLDGLALRYSTDEDVLDAFEDTSDKLKGEELIYASGNQIRTRRWIWRQSDLGRVNPDSKNIVFSIDGFQDNRDSVIAARNALADQLESVFGCNVKTGLLEQKNRTFEMDELTAEEQLIEDTIQVMLKGTAEHTDVDDVREKLEHVFAEKRPLRIKLGLDPSAPDIHIGHAVVLRKVKQLQELGHKAVIIIGDFTGRIGDPTGKSKTRKPLTDEQVKQNAKTYTEQVFKIIDESKTEVRFNSEWLGKMTFADVIDLAAKCTVARIMERDDFNNRFTNHIAIGVHEFFYPLMQAYDSVEIEADVELGGTDQIFNVMMGRNIQRDYGQDPQITLFMPILEGIDGVEKMSKSLGNYIGVNEEPDTIYSKVMQIPDNCIIKYFTLCTDYKVSDIEEVEARLGKGENPRDIKMELAFEITALYHGKDAATTAQTHFIEAYQKNVAPDNTPIISVEVSDGKSIGEALIDALMSDDRFKSKSEIRRMFKQNAVSLNNVKVTDPASISELKNDDILQVGKGKFYRISIT
jgi:tyrosyl-tRNA synthetase (EC 6.1.1.1)